MQRLSVSDLSFKFVILYMPIRRRSHNEINGFIADFIHVSAIAYINLYHILKYAMRYYKLILQL